LETQKRAEEKISGYISIGYLGFRGLLEIPSYR
jgi:hypothetical protein